MTVTTRRPRLAKAKAMATYRVVSKALRTYDPSLEIADHPVRQGTHDPAWYVGPVLCQDFESWYGDPYPWAIVLEGGPYDWSMYVPHGGRTEEYGWQFPEVRLPQGVWVEPINGYSLALYPKDW